MVSPMGVHKAVAGTVCAVPGEVTVRSSNVLRIVAGLDEKSLSTGFIGIRSAFRSDYTPMLVIDRKGGDFRSWRTAT